MKVYDIILNGYECDLEQFDTALDHARDFASIIEDIETTEAEKLPYWRYEDTVKGIDIYYCYGTDVYHFGESEE